MNLPVVNVSAHPNYSSYVDEQRLRDITAKVLENERVSEAAEVSILFAGKKHIRRLNLDYLGIDHATDVLSFPADEKDPLTGRRYLGDIIVCVPVAVSQAEKSGHDATAELELLITHGLLHLLGYDHHDSAQKEAMWKLQQELISDLGIKILHITEG